MGFRLCMAALLAAALSGCVVVPAYRYHDGVYRDGDRREYRYRDGSRYDDRYGRYPRDGSRSGGWYSP